MILTKKAPIIKKYVKLNRIYINTLIPYFKFRNNTGSIITPKKCCITL